MPHNQAFIFWTRLLAVAFLTTGAVLRADDKPADTSDTKTVPVRAGNSTVNVQVKEAADPYRNISSSTTADKYQPDQPNYSSTSPLAHKQFAFSDLSATKNDSFLKANDQTAFVTKSYFAGAAPQADHAVPNLDTQVSPPTSNAYSRRADGFNKSFATSSFDANQNQAAAMASKTSPDQGRMALMSPQTVNTFESPLTSKTYQGVEAAAIHHDMGQISDGLMQMKDLPSRPLTIDEVRALINHDFKPDMNAKPGPPAKALNDPDYKPDVSPAPPPSADDDKNDAVPPPGTMAPPPPEDSEPLPSH